MTRTLTLALGALILTAGAACQDGETTCTAGSLTCLDARADRLAAIPDRVLGEPLRPADAPRGDLASAADSAGPYVHEEITPATLSGWIAAGKVMSLIDVREPSEFASGHIAGAVNLAWSSGVLKASLAQIATDRPLVIYCASGNRSHQAASWLAAQGRKPVYDMQGGIGAWIAAGYPTVK
jgi:rhodanese-related sulfurtransferase